ncbi:uncharacterized protein LOC113375288 [Ctenocephalides felis]|uniref:uncharacterized protein LOC113375288 n=1 Tax=Ctenocephalides felis TaxID=7515 RepID=UPI000E6E4120|nr:uncharacterized protein LOC113375288 [Ctenocephalides felis]
MKLITIDENESAISVCRRVLSGSETDERIQETETAVDGTVWTKTAEVGTPGRSLSNCVFKDVNGPTSYAKKNIITGDLVSAFSLIIDNYIIKHIKQCTEEGAVEFWSTTGQHRYRKYVHLLEFYMLVGPMRQKKLKLTYLWSAKKTWQIKGKENIP